MNVSSSFLRGMRAPWLGLYFLWKRKTWLVLSLFPALLSVALFIAGIVWAYWHLGYYVDQFLLDLAGSQWARSGSVYLAALALAWPAFIGAMLFFGFFIIKILSSPLHGVLAERALRHFAPGSEMKAFSAFVIATGFVQELFLLLSGLPLFVMSLIPGIAVLPGVFFLWLLAFDCLSYSLELKKMGLKQRWLWAIKFSPEIWGFALSLGLLMVLPLINLFLYPAGIIGGAWLIGALHSEEKQRNKGDL